MNLGENIGNAFQVVKKTYENIDKLISYCITASEKESHFVPAVTMADTRVFLIISG